MGNVDPETGIWSMKIAKKRHKFDQSLAEAIYDLYNFPERAVDVGCGSGLYCRFFFERGWRITGIEGTIGIVALEVYDNIITADLTKPFYLNGVYHDFVLCLEVGEHIPNQYEEIFIENLCQLAKKHLVLSWAVPGQYSASGHVNCKKNSYVIARFLEKGYEYDGITAKLLRDQADFKWFKNTLMVFKKGGNNDR